MTKVTNPPGAPCFTYSTCLKLIKAGTKINYEGASGSLDYNTYNNTFGPYGAFQSSPAGVEPQAFLMTATQLAAAPPSGRPRRPAPPPAAELPAPARSTRRGC